MTTPLSLIRQPRFKGFFWTQFLGAFNDNLLRSSLLMLLTFALAGTAHSGLLGNLAVGLFVLPFFCFSAFAGRLADRLEKSRLFRTLKVLELGIMAVAGLGLVTGQVGLLLLALFLTGTQSAFFGPAKYGYLPQKLEGGELVTGNALVEAGGFLAILGGTLAGGLMLGADAEGTWIVATALLAVSLIGWFASTRIPRTSAVAPDLVLGRNPFTGTVRTVRHAMAPHGRRLVILGIAWFWLFGTVYVTQLPALTKDALGGNAQLGSLLLAGFTVGIGIGAMLCQRLSRQGVEPGLVPLGALGMSLFGLDLYFAGQSITPAGSLIGPVAFLGLDGALRVMINLTGLAAAGGLFIVPLQTLLQARSEAKERSRVIAGNNILSALAMVIGSLLGIVFLGTVGLSVPELLLVLALMNAPVALFALVQRPERIMAWLARGLIGIGYRLRPNALDNIPKDGGALVVCNHISYLDALVITALSPRPVRFVMHCNVFRVPLLSWLFRMNRAIPIASAKEDPELLDRAMDQVAEALEAGELVGIFPEGRLTADGKVGPFRKGVERIVARTPVPVVPMALHGLWGSLFSHHSDRWRGRLKTLLRPVHLSVGSPIPANAVSADHAREQVRCLLPVTD